MHLLRPRYRAWACTFGLTLLGLALLSACLPVWMLPNLLPQQRTLVSNSLPLEKKWERRIDELLLGPMLVHDNLVFIPQQHALVALDAVTGQQEWAFASRGVISVYGPEIVVSEGALVLASVAGSYEEIDVLNAATGKVKWTKPALTLYSFAIGNGRLYVGRMGHVSAYDLESGSLVWEVSDGLPSSHRVISVYYNAGILSVSNGVGRVLILDSKDGSVVNSFDYPITRFDIVSDGVMYGVDWSHTVIAVDIKSGATRWRNRISPDVTYIPPTLIRDVLYVRTTDGKLRALDASTGMERWAATNIDHPFSNVAWFSDKGYVISSDGNLHGFALDNGKELGTLVTSPQRMAVWWYGPPAIPSLAVAERTLVVTFGDSFVYGFETQPP